jgi:adenine-specific DNA-methyltransferase
MKFMGSKRAMLQNGLGDLLRREARKYDRIIDLFCGSGSVAWFAAQAFDKPVHAFDLQTFSIVLASSVLERTKCGQYGDAASDWLDAVVETRARFTQWAEADRLDRRRLSTTSWSSQAKAICAQPDERCIVWSSYGGYYFSPTQALTFDAMLHALPKNRVAANLCRAIAVIAASQCAASPGHTAQPFKANHTAGPFLREAWMRCPIAYARKALSALGPIIARKKGKASVSDAVEVARTLQDTDLVFVDPPYSGVHYSRFYHVLETIARGTCGPVSGIGRYPPPSERPTSSFSRKGEAEAALEMLLTRLSNSGCTVILTFPAKMCSNGLSGELVLEHARRSFKVIQKTVKTRFSTLGGNNSHRDARQLTSEMILLLRPKG